MNVKSIINVVGVAVAVTAFCIGCGGDDGDGGNPGNNDPGNNPGGGGGGSGCAISGYKTKPIGSQTWMAENLNCNVSGSVCYDSSEAYCDKYGRLYNWEDAQKACPSGWHLPSRDEWRTLEDYVVGEDRDIGKKLRSTSGWSDFNGNSMNGTDEYGFSALPGGTGFALGDNIVFDGSTQGIGETAYWWSATEGDGGNAFTPNITVGGQYNVYGISKKFLLSVRCVKN